jgi:hypothetical protein
MGLYVVLQASGKAAAHARRAISATKHPGIFILARDVTLAAVDQFARNSFLRAKDIMRAGAIAHGAMPLCDGCQWASRSTPSASLDKIGRRYWRLLFPAQDAPLWEPACCGESR